MVMVSRVTSASIAPCILTVVTDRGGFPLAIPGPMWSIEIPGCRILDLQIGTPGMFQIVVTTCDDKDYNIEDIECFSDLQDIESIQIGDGFRIFPLGYGGYTYRPEYYANGTLYRSGLSYIYPPPTVAPLPPGAIPPMPLSGVYDNYY